MGMPRLVAEQLHPKLVVEAVIIKACEKCGASGTDKNNQDVGDICPKCGADRPKNEDKGVIHSSAPLFKLKRKLNKWLGRQKT